jgi:hypothetical protein
MASPGNGHFLPANQQDYRRNHPNILPPERNYEMTRPRPLPVNITLREMNGTTRSHQGVMGYILFIITGFIVCKLKL